MYFDPIGGVAIPIDEGGIIHGEELGDEKLLGEGREGAGDGQRRSEDASEPVEKAKSGPRVHNMESCE
jgi:hypothetical protein